MSSSRQSPGLQWGSDNPGNPGLFSFTAWVPMILGTPMIGCVMNVIREREIDALAMPCINAHVAYLLAVWWATTMVEDDRVDTKVLDSMKYDEIVTTKDSQMIDAFSFRIIHRRMKTAFTSVKLNVMTQALHAEEGPLPQGLTIQNIYTEMHYGSKNVTVMVGNSMAYPQTLKKKIPVARVVAANQVLEPQMWPEMMESLDEAQGIQMQKLTSEQRQEKLFEKLDLSGLGSLPPELADSAWSLLAEYHDIFSLEPYKLGCTHLTEHVITVIDNAQFKEWFRQIPLLLIEEVHTHLWEMLDSGTVCPSQSVWCNVVVLVRKKDGGLCFCIDFCHLNACTKKDSYPLLRIQEALKSLVSAGHFSCLDLKSGFWQIKMDELLKQYTAFTVGSLGFFECDCMPFGLCNAPATFQRLMQNCLGELNLTYCLIYLDDIMIFSWTTEEHLHHLCIIFDWFREHNLKLKPSKCNFFRKEITYLAHWVLKDGVYPSNSNLEAIAECTPLQTYVEVHAFLGMVSHCQRSIKGFVHIAQPLSEYLSGGGASRRSEWVLLS